jgi:Heterokaryon incompatibility protein (HET)
MSKVKGWVRNCDQKHEECASSMDTRLPKRILDITDKPIVRVTNGAKGSYVALSYCWGTSGKNVLLTRSQVPSNMRSTFDEFTSVGIEMDTLAKTIQDAIVVCRNLGIKYLWVDALCIIQEERDSKDFNDEAPKMSEYYKNAYLTLIVGSARDCAEGFLNERRKPKSSPCEVEYNSTTVALDSPEKDMTGVVRLSLPSSQDAGYILTRAWTYQESFLSQRSLTYGLEQIFFSCLTCEKCEDGRFQMASGLDKNPLTAIERPLRRLQDLNSHSNKTEAPKDAFDMWQASITSYTNRNMSNPLDKLAAIAGYAKLVQEIVQCQYIYGLWENDLVTGLLWRTATPTRKSSAITRVVDRAPSWSWASINGRIIARGSPDRRKLTRSPEYQRLKIMSYKNVSNSLDPIRDNVVAPKAFELTVRGLLRKVWYLPGKVGEIDLLADSKGEHIAFGSWDTYDDFEGGKYLGCQVHALLLVSEIGLLLIHVDGNNYRRIGWFRKAKEELFVDLEDITLI